MDEEVYILDIEGTNEGILLNSNTRTEVVKSKNYLYKTLNLVDLNAETTMININGAYITTKRNALNYHEMYGWHFCKKLITEL